MSFAASEVLLSFVDDTALNYSKKKKSLVRMSSGDGTGPEHRLAEGCPAAGPAPPSSCMMFGDDADAWCAC